MKIRLFDKIKVVKQHTVKWWENNQVLSGNYQIYENELGIVQFYWNDGSFIVKYEDHGFYAWYKEYKESELIILPTGKTINLINYK